LSVLEIIDIMMFLLLSIIGFEIKDY